MVAFRRIQLCAVVGILLTSLGHNVQAQAQGRVRVIIGFAQQPGPNQQALVRSFGGSIFHTYWLIPAIAAEVPQVALQALGNNPNVARITLDTVVSEVDAELDAAWGVKRIGSGVVHEGGNKGTGARVCVIDSGVAYNHADLGTNYLGGYDFVNGDSAPLDDRGHGSHVTGSVLALDNGVGVVGVAPEALVLAYKILDQNGQGYISNAVAALQACISAGGQVTNSSFGTDSDPGPDIKAAYDNAEAMGLVNVAAAGNRTRPGTCTSVAFPARYSSVIAVTAVDSNLNIANFSCRGPEAELAAPGVNIYSTVPTGSCADCTSSGYNTLSGTSMASPHVAGVAALVIASGIGDANLNGRINDEVRLRLQQTADDLGTAGRDSNYGYGLVDADEAAPPVPPDPPPPPTAWTFCAPEGGVCAFTGTMEVRYGANGSFFFKTLTGGTACTNEVFGDPIFGTVKQCDIRSTPPPTAWTFCAPEGGVCAFTGTMEVRYGANGSFFFKTLTVAPRVPTRCSGIPSSAW